jgi:hypothetical protein
MQEAESDSKENFCLSLETSNIEPQMPKYWPDVLNGKRKANRCLDNNSSNVYTAVCIVRGGTANAVRMVRHERHERQNTSGNLEE